jgi:RHS repeat-associated protein
VKARHDYLPFGEEIGLSGGRTEAQGYVVDSVKQKFTGYERDNETGMDFAQARYYASAQGRFTSPDDFLNDTHASDPASWNLYTYVRNNPLRFIDPNGTIKRDANGNIILDVTRENVTRTYYNGQLVGGGRLVVTGQVDTGHVYADDGTAIEADRSRGALTATVYDADGNMVSQGDVNTIKVNGESWTGFNNTADCHGVTFAEGQVWINDNQVRELMRGDGYDINNPVSTPTINDVGIYSTDGSLSSSTVRHSVRVTKTDAHSGNVTEVKSKGGITREVNTVPGPGPNTAWYDTNAKLRYYRKDPLLSQIRKHQGLVKAIKVY